MKGLEVEQATELRTPTEWQTVVGVRIADADGWRHNDAPSWDTPISREEFMYHMAGSTVMFTSGFAWKDI